MVTELVTNAYKYAYPAGCGEIRVESPARSTTSVVLSVEDDGIGWAGSGGSQGSGVGCRIINAMSTNLRATLAYNSLHAGTRVTVEFTA